MIGPQMSNQVSQEGSSIKLFIIDSVGIMLYSRKIERFNWRRRSICAVPDRRYLGRLVFEWRNWLLRELSLLVCSVVEELSAGGRPFGL